MFLSRLAARDVLHGKLRPKLTMPPVSVNQNLVDRLYCVRLADDVAREGRALAVDVAVVVDAHEGRAAPEGRREGPVPAAHVALHPGLVEHVEGHHRARGAVPLDHAVHLAEELSGPRRAAVGRLAGVVGLVPRAELAHPEAAEVGHEPPDLRLVLGDRREPGLPDPQVVAGDVQEHRELLRQHQAMVSATRAARRAGALSIAFHAMKYRTRLNFARWKAGWSNIDACWSPMPMRTAVRACAAAEGR